MMAVTTIDVRTLRLASHLVLRGGVLDEESMTPMILGPPDSRRQVAPLPTGSRMFPSDLAPRRRRCDDEHRLRTRGRADVSTLFGFFHSDDSHAFVADSTACLASRHLASGHVAQIWRGRVYRPGLIGHFF
jgi:hypothetical protein